MSDTDTALLDPETEQADTPSEDGQEQAGDEAVDENQDTEQADTPSDESDVFTEPDLTNIPEELRDSVKSEINKTLKGYRSAWTKKTQELAFAKKVAEDVNRAAQEAGYPDYFAYKQAAIAKAQAKEQDEPETPEDDEYLTEEQKKLNAIERKLEKFEEKEEEKENLIAANKFSQTHSKELAKLTLDERFKLTKEVVRLEKYRDWQVSVNDPETLTREDILDYAYKKVTYPQAKKAQQATTVKAKQPPKMESGSAAGQRNFPKKETLEERIGNNLMRTIEKRMGHAT